MYKGVACCFVISALSLCSSVLAQQDEKLTITTYYPSPTGVYQTLKVVDKAEFNTERKGGHNHVVIHGAGPGLNYGVLSFSAYNGVNDVNTGGVWGFIENNTTGHECGGLMFAAKNETDAYPLHRMIINREGNVGINVYPTKRLHINSTSDHMLLLQQDNSTTPGKYAGAEWLSGGRAGYVFVMNDVSTNYGGAGSMNLYTSNGNMTFNTNTTEKMRITNDGNVGIGTPNPSARLHAHELTALGASAGDSQLLTKTSGRSGNLFQRNLWLYRNSAGNDWYTASLHDAISIDSSYLTPQTNTRVWWERDPYNRIQSWGTAGDKYMQLRPNALQVASTLQVQTNFTSGTALYFSADGGADPYIGSVAFTPSSSAMAQNILVKIGRTDFVGNVFMPDLASSLVATNEYLVVNPTNGRLFRGAAVSSRRYKENIEDSALGLDSVMRLRPVSFDFKKEYAPDAPRQIGLIAEEVETVSPLLVGYKNDRPESVQYDRLGPVLIKAIQEQQQEIVELKREIAELKKRR
ncbi:MAG TPA: tail fiber domain-containing protein [Candidatus Omnitrophota bacterium]|nr:tail fiber domain-containing protein [Candidatus Omnitrophota bacterium]HQQ06426.1 tail fiber domain-containing protein [Candidatus Omnitrophota bacterium]